MNIRQSIVKTYRMVGIVLLLAVLVALMSYLTVNAYYAASRSWVMPELLTTNDVRVVAAVTALGDAEIQLDELSRQRDDATLERKRLELTLVQTQAFVTAFGGAPAAVASVTDRAVLQRELAAATIELALGPERDTQLQKELTALETRLARQQALVAQLRQSPYLRVANGNVAVVFLPYRNSANAAAGTALYSCWTTLLFCENVGTVRSLLPGEVMGHSPQDSQLERGVFAEVDVSEAGMRQRVLFLGRAPLLF